MTTKTGLTLLGDGKFIGGSSLPILIPSQHHLQGMGPEVTVLTQASSIDKDILNSENFAAETGQATDPGTYKVTLSDMTVDGNLDNNAAGWALRKYGHSWMVRNMIFQYATDGGVWAEWASGVGAPDLGMEDLWTTIRIARNEGKGLVWRGPHDSNLMQFFVHDNDDGGAIFVHSEGVYSGSNAVISDWHTWRNGSTTYGIEVIGCSMFMTNMQVEGHTGIGGAGIFLDNATTCVLEGTNHIFLNETGIIINGGDNQIKAYFTDGSGNDQTGVRLGTGSGAPNEAHRNIIDGYFRGCKVAIHFQNSSGRNLIRATVRTESGTVAITDTDMSSGDRFAPGWGEAHEGGGTNYVILSEGTGTINSGGVTSGNIAHGLSKAPRKQDIQITLHEDPDNDVGIVWIDSVDATNIVIKCKSDPGASNLDFGWTAKTINALL